MGASYIDHIHPLISLIALLSFLIVCNRMSTPEANPLPVSMIFFTRLCPIDGVSRLNMCALMTHTYFGCFGSCGALDFPPRRGWIIVYVQNASFISDSALACCLLDREAIAHVNSCHQF
jgi:hypothetical protein